MNLHRKTKKFYSQAELLELLKNKKEILKSKDDNFFLGMVERLTLIDDVVIALDDCWGSFYYENPTTGKKANVYRTTYRGRKWTVTVQDVVGVLSKRHLLIDEGATKVNAQKIALDWVLHGEVSERTKQDYYLLFSQAEKQAFTRRSVE
jgi:hypothetical protein